MSISLTLAALLLVLIGSVHSVLGEHRLIGPLLHRDFRRGILRKSAFARQTLRFAWHLTTLAWFGIAGVLFVFAWAPVVERGWYTLAIVSVTFLCSGFVTFVASRGRHLAWPVFFAIGGLALVPLF